MLEKIDGKVGRKGKRRGENINRVKMYSKRRSKAKEDTGIARKSSAKGGRHEDAGRKQATEDEKEIWEMKASTKRLG